MRLTTTVPGVKIVSEANLRQHWAARKRRKDQQQHHAHLALVTLGKDARRAVIASPTIRVRLVRLGGRRIDSDNLAGGFKGVRDTVAKWACRDDGSLSYEWEYGQEACSTPGFRIEIETVQP